MLLIFTTFLVLLAGVSLAVMLKKLSGERLLDENRPGSLDAENFRPLFAPTDDDLRLAEAEERKQLAAKQAEDERLISEEKFANLENTRQTWRRSPNKAETIELLYRASQVASGEAYLETAGAVLEAWRAGEISGLTADDLAHLLESHYWLLPTGERTPGVSFRIQQETADLRRVSAS